MGEREEPAGGRRRPMPGPHAVARLARMQRACTRGWLGSAWLGPGGWAEAGREEERRKWRPGRERGGKEREGGHTLGWARPKGGSRVIFRFSF
jgi:hypothetical protein